MRRKGRRRSKARRNLLLVGLIIVLLLVAFVYYHYSQSSVAKPIILYINQGNGVVDESNFGTMLSFASSEGFNTIFFQIYREGVTLFAPSQLNFFVNHTHAAGMKIFFALYITNSSQTIPTTIFNLGEDGISLDMSALSIPSQEGLLQELGSCGCQTAVTTTDMTSPLKPDLLVLETYGSTYDQYIRQGVVASVGVFTTTSQANYQSEYQYALNHSDGVMVFDYAGLVKSGY